MLLDFCTDLCNKEKLTESVLDEFLFAFFVIGPLDPARIVAVAERAGYYASASDVPLLVEILKRQGITEGDFGGVFRRCRTTARRPWREWLYKESQRVSEFEAAVHVRGTQSTASTSLRERFGKLAGKAGATLRTLGEVALLMVVSAVCAFMWDALSSIHLKILLTFVGTPLAITVVLNLLIWGSGRALTSGEDKIDQSHEWRVVTSSGRPGGRVKSATRKDVYDHVQGHGSWNRRRARIQSTCVVLGGLVALACPFFALPVLWDAGVKDLGPIIGYFLVYPLLPLALLLRTARWVRSL